GWCRSWSAASSTSASHTAGQCPGGITTGAPLSLWSLELISVGAGEIAGVVHDRPEGRLELGLALAGLGVLGHRGDRLGKAQHRGVATPDERGQHGCGLVIGHELLLDEALDRALRIGDFDAGSLARIL